MANPLLLAGLIGAGGELISNVPKLFNSKYDKDQKRALEELKRREELGLLGLSEQERSILEDRLAGRSKQASDAAAAQRARLLAGSGGATAGTALQEAVLQDEARAAQEVAAQAAIEEENAREVQREEQELAAREAQVAQRSADRTQAIANIAAAGAESTIETLAQNQLFQGTRRPSARSVNLLVQKYNIGEDEARGMLELAAENPSLLSYLDRLSGE